MKIMIDASFDLHAAGLDNDEAACEAFEAAYRAKAAKLYPDVTVVSGSYQGSMQGCDTSEEANEIWQAIHDAVARDTRK